jgi:crotonobetainyl-CoA:carnitine CoA-transferase CaiB-like acyl-CoA transferase
VRPLEDVRIVAVEQYGAGPWGSVHLADLGAEVIKIEDPRTAGDVGRTVPPYRDGDHSLFFETFNRNKRSLALDISTPGGREVFEDLVRVSDAVWSNLRGDVPARLRITYDDLAPINPQIVCCSLTGFGMTGPRAAEPGYDYILQGLCGWMDVTGEPDGPPTKSGLSLVDYSGGFVAAIALLAGVHAARRDGKGMDCDISLFDTAVSLLTYPGTWHLSAGYTPERISRSAHPSLVPFQVFAASDGWMVVGCAKEKFWHRLVELIDDPDLAHERFATFDDRLERRDEVVEILDRSFAEDTVASWISRLTKAGVPCGPVNSMAEAFVDPHVAARHMVIETDHPVLGTVRQPASPVKVAGALAPGEHRPAPLPDEGADYVLGEVLGYDADRRTALDEAGAFGDWPAT